MKRPLINWPNAYASGQPTEEPDGVCNLCGTHILQSTPYGKPILNPVISREYGTAAHVQVSLTAGELDSDWGAGEITAYTLCPDCFEHKLMPWLEAQGAIPEVTSWVS